jgi:hypothetical protein
MMFPRRILQAPVWTAALITFCGIAACRPKEIVVSGSGGSGGTSSGGNGGASSTGGASATGGTSSVGGGSGSGGASSSGGAGGTKSTGGSGGAGGLGGAGGSGGTGGAGGSGGTGGIGAGGSGGTGGSGGASTTPDAAPPPSRGPTAGTTGHNFPSRRTGRTAAASTPSSIATRTCRRVRPVEERHRDLRWRQRLPPREAAERAGPGSQFHRVRGHRLRHDSRRVHG